MSTFYTGIINFEGGYVDNPVDKGGATKYGISEKEYPNLDIRNLTLGKALEIYKKDYWDKNDLGSIKNQAIANLIFVLVVNVGGNQAFKIVQQALNSMGYSLTIDGVIGAQTLGTLNSCNSGWLIDAIHVGECKYYLNLVNRDSNQLVFFHGWINRALTNA